MKIAVSTDERTPLVESLFSELKDRGHEVVDLPDWSPSVGGGHGIKKDQNLGSYQGGADPRRDGYAIGT